MKCRYETCNRVSADPKADGWHWFKIKILSESGHPTVSAFDEPDTAWWWCPQHAKGLERQLAKLDERALAEMELASKHRH
jgi:hypothetical protein